MFNDILRLLAFGYIWTQISNVAFEKALIFI